MRTLRPATNLVLGCLAALALLTTLDFPWVCPAVSDPVVTDGPVERAAFQVAHVFAHADGATSGTLALGDWRLLLVVLVSVLILLAGMAGVPALRNGVRDALRMVALILPVAVAFLVITRPGNAGEGIQWGSLLGLVVAAMAGNAAWHGAAIRAPRRPAPVRAEL